LRKPAVRLVRGPRGAGARVKECARLDVDDIAVTAGTIRLHGKGDEVGDVPLPTQARERLSAWIRERA
jgi:site-specific recombinase XerC